MPPKVSKVPSPESTESNDFSPPDNSAFAATLDRPSDAVLDLLVEKTESAHKKLDSLKPFLQTLEGTLKQHCDRITEVEKSALSLDLKQAPPLPENMYLGLQAKDVFLTVLSATIQALIAAYPTVFRDQKTAYRNSHLMTAVAVALEAVEAVKERLPRME